MEMPRDVNRPQWEAVTYHEGHLLIVAGPGTGKTHTLTYRIKEALKGLQKNEKILAVTFTNKAADEMRRRLKKHITNLEEKIFIGTFHNFCLNILQEIKDFKVADEKALAEISKVLWPENTLGERKSILNRISRYKSTEFEGDVPDEVIVYNEKLRQLNLLDFDDLLLETYQFLKSNVGALNQIHQAYRYIFVDEYQDINTIQHALLKLLVGLTGQITAIGDPNQAIYGFRGSELRFFEEFTRDFKGAKKMSLSENYRSAKDLLSASTQVMTNSLSLYVPDLTANIYAKGRLTVYEAPTEKAEAEYVVHKIEQLVGGTSMFSQDSARVANDDQGDITFGDIAVLYRLNSQGTALKAAFERSGIPYSITMPKTDDPLDDICPKRGYDIRIEVEKVSLMTLHAAKGLEFAAVFIVGCERNILPLNLKGLSSDIEEERRLFYVGMTRAKTHLYLTNAKKHFLFGKQMNNSVSPFVLDIEKKLKSIEKIKKPKVKKSQEEQLSLF